MGFRTDSYAKVWKVEDKGNFHNVQLSISKKDKATNEYVQDFSGFVKFIGTAHNLAKDLKAGDRIKIGSCDVNNSFNKDKNITYYNCLVFSYEPADGNASGKTSKTTTSTASTTTDDDDGELPF